MLTDIFFKKEGKWTEILYIQLFFFLRDHQEWLSKCRLDTQTMVNLYRKPLNSLEEPEPEKPSIVQDSPTMSKEASPMTEINSPGEPQGICPTLRRLVEVPSAPPLPLYPATLHPQHHPTGLYPFQMIMEGRGLTFISD
jgi:hypothetical protein